MPATGHRRIADPWRLPYTHPAVRDLAFLLQVASPYATPACESLRQRLLGRDGLSRLAALDAAPRRLEDALASCPSSRLGRYAETLLAFWFDDAPHCRLVAHALPLHDPSGRTLGEFDFLLWLDDEPWHIELACKLYLQLDTDENSLIGASVNDAWPLKARTLARQVTLAQRVQAATQLPAGFAACRSAVLLSGWRFTPEVPSREAGAMGWWRPSTAPWPVRTPRSRWLPLSRQQYLAPVRVRATPYQEADLRARLAGLAAPQWVAELLPEAGLWREVGRGVVVPPAWPDPARLAALQARIAREEAA